MVLKPRFTSPDRTIPVEELPPVRRPGPVVDKVGMTLGELIASGAPAYLVVPTPQTQKLYRPAGISPALPTLGGVGLQPRPPLELRAQIAAARIAGLVMDEGCATSILVSAIRRHRARQISRPSSQDFNRWLLTALDLGEDAAPLLYRELVRPEIELTHNLLRNSTSIRSKAA